MTYTHIGGSIFRNGRQILVIVPVSGKPAERDKIVDKLVRMLNRDQPKRTTPKSKPRRDNSNP